MSCSLSFGTYACLPIHSRAVIDDCLILRYSPCLASVLPVCTCSVSRRIMHDIAASPAYTSSTHALLISGGQHHRPGGTASSYGTSPGG
jgi:hypothetical protein